jgi:predicted GIY-YIG superfamily endonuclease
MGYYEYKKIGDIPAKCGIYAWYLPIQIRGNVAKNPEKLMDKLIQYADTLKRPKAKLELKGHLSMKQEGTIEQIPYGSEGNQYSDKLNQQLSDQESREIMIKIMNMASYNEKDSKNLSANPGALLTPLYIGVSIDLNKRMKDHASGINKELDLLQNASRNQFNSNENNEEMKDMEETEKRISIFSKRIAKRIHSAKLFRPDNLVVFALPLEISGEKGKIREAVEAMETLLNRVHYPALGRR